MPERPDAVRPDAVRPDPDQLLDRLKQEEERARRGKLKIFFGASAGVGKTFAMLNAAQHSAGWQAPPLGAGVRARVRCKPIGFHNPTIFSYRQSARTPYRLSRRKFRFDAVCQAAN